MKIAIDALGISRPGGGRSATLNLLEPLFELDKDNEYIVFLDNTESSLIRPNVRQILAPVHGRLSSRLWAQLIWPGLLRRENVELIHHTKHLVTNGNPCPTVVTIHDLTMLVRPGIFPAVDEIYYRTIEKHNLRGVQHIIAVSQTTAKDVRTLYGIPADRVSVILEGISDDFKPASDDAIARVRAKYDLPERYLVHVGSIWKKKNLVTLVRAFEQLRRMNSYDGVLVLVGQDYIHGGDAELEQAISVARRYGPVIRTGSVPQEDLPAIMSGADCFVFPSLHEGFGLVPLEAMACGVPVIAARSSAVEEVLGAAAILVDDPHDIPTFTHHINQVLHDPVLYSDMIAKGLEQAGSYSRERSARLTLDLYQKLAQPRRE
jgi:glycosyltransferase involved in cell wall biosynthesis